MSQHKLDSLEPLINRKVLFVKEIDPSLSKAEIRTELLMVCSEVQVRDGSGLPIRAPPRLPAGASAGS